MKGELMVQLVISDILHRLSLISGREVSLHRIVGLSGGCIHHASRIETSVGSFFLKWNYNCADDIFTSEAESLRQLKNAAPLPLIIPSVVLDKKVDQSPGYLLLEYLEPGSNPKGDDDLGKGLANLHRCKGNSFGFFVNTYCGSTLQDNTWCNDWHLFYAQQRIGNLVAKIIGKKAFTVQNIRLFNRLIQRIPDLLPQSSQPSLIHGDLWSGNYMHTRMGTALFDPAAYFADREMEMGIMTLFGGFGSRFWDAYNENFPLPYGWGQRNKLYQLYHLLNHYLLFGGGYGEQAVLIAEYYAGN